LRKGVIVRPVANYGLPNHLRISIGTQAENQFFLKVLAETLADV
jgi:histidinol-phosphate aminotransferase